MKFLEKNSRLRTALLSIFTVAALSMDQAMVSDGVVESISQHAGHLTSMLIKLSCSIEDYSIAGILAVLFCFVLYEYAFSQRKLKRHEWVLGVLMALTFVFGRAFEEYDTTAVLAAGLMQMVKTLVILTGGCLFFPQLVKAVECCVSECVRSCSGPIPRGGVWRAGAPLDSGFDLMDAVKYRRVILAFIVVVWSVTYIAFFPGLFQGDTEDIIYMSYNYHTGLADSVIRIDESSMWVDHHSVLYTVLLGAFVKGARALCGNENVGIAVYSAIQGFFMAWVLAYSLYKLKLYKVCPLIRTGLAVFYAFFPWMPRYAFMATKDTLFAGFLMLYILLIMDLAFEAKDKIRVNEILRLVAYSVVIFLLRKNGLYVCVLSLPFLLMINKKWIKTLAIVLLCILAVKFAYSHILLPACHITDGSIRAALPVPLHQTARYVHYFPDEVTQEERQAIDRVVDYDSFAANYETDRSLYVQACWRKEADGRDLAAYVKVWGKMLFKHPLTYVAATANNNYGYFYPVVIELSDFEKASNGSYQNINRDQYFDFHPTENVLTKSAGTLLRVCDQLIEKAPLINLVCTSAVYVWILVFAWTAGIVNHDRKLLMPVVVLLILMLTIIAGPDNGNGYHRFTYPVAMCAPVVAAFASRGYGERREDG